MNRPFFANVCCVSLLLAGILSSVITAANGPKNAPAYVGTFAAVKQMSNGNFSGVVLRIEPRQNLGQVTGQSTFNGKVDGVISGTYFPANNQLRLVVKETSGKKRQTNVNGKFVSEFHVFEMWPADDDPSVNIVRAGFLDVPRVDGYYEGGPAKLSITEKNGQFTVSGTIGSFVFKGSYYAKSNLLAARLSPGIDTHMTATNVDGHYDPISGRFRLWISEPNGTIKESYSLSKRLGGSPPPPVIPPGASSDRAGVAGAVWKQREKYRETISGTWTLQSDRRTFKAKWGNGAEATLTLETLTRTRVIVTREDKSGVSKGLKARYEGNRDGNYVQGSVNWTWADGKKGKGTWSADLPD